MPKILIVEDDKDIVNNLTEYLRDEGFDVDSAADRMRQLTKWIKTSMTCFLWTYP